MVHICQGEGCFSAKAPIWRVIINLVGMDSLEVMASGKMSALICEDCRGTIKLQGILSGDDWGLIVEGFKAVLVVVKPPSFEKSFLTFEKILGPNIH